MGASWRLVLYFAGNQDTEVHKIERVVGSISDAGRRARQIVNRVGHRVLHIPGPGIERDQAATATHINPIPVRSQVERPAAQS